MAHGYEGLILKRVLLRRRSHNSDDVYRAKRLLRLDGFLLFLLFLFIKRGMTLVAGIFLRGGSDPLAVGVCLDGPEGFRLIPSVALWF